MTVRCVLGGQAEPDEDEFGMMEVDINGNAEVPLYQRREYYALRRSDNRRRQVAQWNWDRFGARSSFPTGRVGQLEGTSYPTPSPHAPADVDDYARLKANEKAGRYVGQFKPFG